MLIMLSCHFDMILKLLSLSTLCRYDMVITTYWLSQYVHVETDEKNQQLDIVRLPQKTQSKCVFNE